MGNCLVTKLKGIVSDQTRLKLGEFVVDFIDKSTITFNETHDGRVLNGYFTNANGDNLGTTKTNSDSFTCSAGSKLILTNKYGVSNIKGNNDGKFTINVDYFKYNTLPGGFYNCNKSLVGDIANLRNKHLNSIQADGCKNLYGDFSDLNVSSNIAFISLLACPITMDVSVLSKFKGLQGVLSLPSKASGVLSITDINNDLDINAGYGEGLITGDLSKLNGRVVKLNTQNRPNKFTWKSERPSSSYITIFNGYVDFGDDIDAMLINQAKCTKKLNDAFILKGNRTSASDAAVATLQSKGFTIWINDAKPNVG